MTAVLVALLPAAFAAGWWLRGDRQKTRRLDAHFQAVRADVFAESGERLYDQLEAFTAAHTSELTRLQDKNLRYRALLRGRATT